MANDLMKLLLIALLLGVFVVSYANAQEVTSVSGVVETATASGIVNQQDDEGLLASVYRRFLKTKAPKKANHHPKPPKKANHHPKPPKKANHHPKPPKKAHHKSPSASPPM
eukprot:TRINITY_DN123_c0_g1_i7.p1 TRINITY_DN123_c0_g1~~TRINITY_DN123_c0_g1_i7.p1  ORF type:complete len:111 (-),score=15.69 TRINITY_DN123_c0_g1_i7:314-646(-)